MPRSTLLWNLSRFKSLGLPTFRERASARRFSAACAICTHWQRPELHNTTDFCICRRFKIDLCIGSQFLSIFVGPKTKILGFPLQIHDLVFFACFDVLPNRQNQVTVYTQEPKVSETRPLKKWCLEDHHYPFKAASCQISKAWPPKHFVFDSQHLDKALGVTSAIKTIIAVKESQIQRLDNHYWTMRGSYSTDAKTTTVGNLLEINISNVSQGNNPYYAFMIVFRIHDPSGWSWWYIQYYSIESLKKVYDGMTSVWIVTMVMYGQYTYAQYIYIHDNILFCDSYWNKIYSDDTWWQMMDIAMVRIV